MIIGPVGYFSDNSFLSYFQALDFLAMQGVSASSAGLNKPLLCNGANIAYEKKLFDELNVYKKDDIASGDDMFMLHKAYSSYPDKVKYLKAESAIVKTYPCKTWKSLFQQRLRWAGKVKYFDTKESVLILLFLLIINIMILALAFLGVFESSYIKYFLIAISIKALTDIFFLWPVAKFFRQSHMLSLFLAVQFVHFIYMAVVGVLSNILPYSWKGRKIKK
jgi:cellulose synthase/poly-beta-1,6-N-acetylglucosamine synthase-like glycosyltransferase